VASSKNSENPRGEIRRGFFHVGAIVMIKGTLLSPATSNAGSLAKSGLDLEGWPRWMREAFATQPEATAPAMPEAVAAPARVDPASIRKLTRMPPHS
jgi:hypothetical protein